MTAPAEAVRLASGAQRAVLAPTTGSGGLLARVVRAPGGAVGTALLAFVALALLAGPLAWAPDPDRQFELATELLRAPSAAHPFGTDGVARDVLARVLAGGRLSLALAAAIVVLATLLGTAWGLVAGLAGARTDAAMMRLVDAGLAVPRVLVLLVVLAVPGGESLARLVVAVAATGWFGVARLVRDDVRRLRASDWVLAARALGTPRREIARRHLAPHVAGTVLVTMPLGVGHVVALEAALSWLGIGVQPPRASWGTLIREGTDVLVQAPWLALAPGACLVVVVLACTLVADALRDALDAREGARP